MKRAELLEELIKEKGYSKKSFAEKINIPPTTLASILSRGVGKASVDNVIKICRGLGITIDQMEEMARQDTILTVAAHHDGEDYTEEELAQIEQFKRFVLNERKKKNTKK